MSSFMNGPWWGSTLLYKPGTLSSAIPWANRNSLLMDFNRKLIRSGLLICMGTKSSEINEKLCEISVHFGETPLPSWALCNRQACHHRQAIISWKSLNQMLALDFVIVQQASPSFATQERSWNSLWCFSVYVRLNIHIVCAKQHFVEKQKH